MMTRIRRTGKYFLKLSQVKFLIFHQASSEQELNFLKSSPETSSKVKKEIEQLLNQNKKLLL